MRVGVDRPLQARQRRVQFAADRGQGDVDDRVVHRHDQQAHAADRQDRQPPAVAELGCTVHACTSSSGRPADPGGECRSGKGRSTPDADDRRDHASPTIPTRWAALGFAVQRDVCQLGGRAPAPGGRAERRRACSRWSLRELAGAELDGLPTTISDRPAAPAGAGASQRGALDRPRRRGLPRLRAQQSRRCRRRGWTCAGCARSRPRRARRARPSSASAREILELVQEPEDVVGRARAALTAPRASGGLRCSSTTSTARPQMSPARRRGPRRGAAGAADLDAARSAGLAMPRRADQPASRTTGADRP